ncbi:MAG: hypothetical protein ACJ74Y_11875 [Bryobacteraceae bacterium]
MCLPNDHNLIGVPLTRFDGRLKVTGAARYAAEYAVANLAHAVVVPSSIVRGRFRDISTGKALSYPGVLDVITHQNAPRLAFFESNPQNRPGQTHLVLQDDAVLYQGNTLPWSLRRH